MIQFITKQPKQLRMPSAKATHRGWRRSWFCASCGTRKVVPCYKALIVSGLSARRGEWGRVCSVTVHCSFDSELTQSGEL